jgi:hypothetical protein
VVQKLVKTKLKHSKFHKIEAKQTSLLVILKKKKEKKLKLRFSLDRSEEKRMYSFLNYRRFAIAISNVGEVMFKKLSPEVRIHRVVPLLNESLGVSSSVLFTTTTTTTRNVGQ